MLQASSLCRIFLGSGCAVGGFEKRTVVAGLVGLAGDRAQGARARRAREEDLCLRGRGHSEAATQVRDWPKAGVKAANLEVNWLYIWV